MREFIKQLQELRDAKNAGEFVKKEKLAYTALDFFEKQIKQEIAAAVYEIKKENVVDSIKKDKLKIKANPKSTKEELKQAARARVQIKFQSDLDDFKKLAYELLDEDGSTTLDWVERIPELLLSDKRSKRKKAKKAALNLIQITSQRNILSWETIDALKRQVTLTKSFSALKKLYQGEEVVGFKVPSLKARFDAAKKRAVADAAARLVPDTSISYEAFLEFEKTKLANLNKKRAADKVATGLNVIVSVLGVGLVGAIALAAILPTIGIALSFPAALVVVAVVTLLGGYTEGFVYFGYVQKFCRQLFVGFFEGIDNKILNERAFKRFGKRDRHALTDDEIATIKKEYAAESIIKKTLVVFSFVLAIAAGVGYMGLMFTEILSFLPVALLASMPALVFLPWILAGIVAPVYAIVMAGMLYKAVKDNYAMKIWQHLKELYLFEYAPEGRSYAAHIALCFLKTLGIAVVLGLSVVAIVSTAGLWMETTVNFLATALNLIEKVATGVGLAIWSVYLLTTLWFCFEKSLETMNSVTQIKLENLKASAKDVFSSPKKFFSFMCDLVLMVFHIASNASVAELGAKANTTSSIINVNMPVGSGAISDAGSELFIDGGDALGINHSHHHSSYAKLNLGRFYTDKEKHDHDHSGHTHGSIVKTGIKAVGVAKSAVKKAGEWLGFFAAPVKHVPKPISAFGAARRAI